MVRVAVQFYGIARLRAGVTGVDVFGDTVGAVLAEVARQFPALADVAGKQFLLSIDGERFVTDHGEPITASSTLLILSADAGG